MQGGCERPQLGGQGSCADGGLSILGSTLVLPWQSWTAPGSSQNLSNAFPPTFKMRRTLLSPLPQSSAPTLEPAKTTLPYLISPLPG